MSVLASLQRLKNLKSNGISSCNSPLASAEDKDRSKEAIDFLKFALIIGQLALLLLIIRQFQIQSSAFLRVSLLITAGFAIHYFLPFRMRLKFFSFLSILTIGVVFGAQNTFWLTSFGLLLIGICELPIAMSKRVLLLLITCTAFVLFRAGVIEGPWSNAIWPILGSMFIFRIIVYLYDTRHETNPSTLSQKLGYFFMLPNVCFPMFPVVDYTEFRRTYYNDERHRIYQIGVDWMVRGILQLLLYRFIYQYVTLTPSEVSNPDTLVQFLVSNFLLYLRISGYFHLITGLLHLFGFNVLATHHRYCLASSFTDFWRRINIYWKDFMMKLFYYPIMFRLRSLGQAKALVIATLVVFLATWLLHSWLWFWLRGQFPVIWQDAVFWGTLASVVIVNSLMEIKKGRKRSLSRNELDLKGAVILGLKTVGIFYFIVILWSLWTTDTFTAWLSMWAFFWNDSLTPAQAFPKYFLIVTIVIFISAIYYGKASRGQESEAEKAALQQSPLKFSTLSMLLLVALAGLPHVYKNFDPQLANLIVSVKSGQLSRADEAALERGYYEQLTRIDRFNSQLWEMYMNKPKIHWLDVKGTGLMRFTGDFLQEELTPKRTSSTPYGIIQTNTWGMRDREYSHSTPPNTFRIAVLGASSVMGWGVEQDQTFESLVETKMQEQGGLAGYQNVELLNFAVAGYYPLQQVPVLEKAVSFRPQAVFYVATGREQLRSLDYLVNIVHKGIDIPYQGLSRIVEMSEVHSDMDEATIRRYLAPYKSEITKWLYDQIVSRSQANGATPVWVFLPSVDKGRWLDSLPETENMARQSGFVIINLNGIFDNQPVEEIRLEEWDKHPNTLGHQLIANALFESVVQRFTELN